MSDNHEQQPAEDLLKKRWQAMPKIDWDGESQLYSLSEDRLFKNARELESFCYDQNRPPWSLMLVICEPNIDSCKYYSRVLPDETNFPGDSDLLQEIEDAFNRSNLLNEFIRKYRTLISWKPGKFAPTHESVMKAMGFILAHDCRGMTVDYTPLIGESSGGIILCAPFSANPSKYRRRSIRLNATVVDETAELYSHEQERAESIKGKSDGS